MKHTSIVYLNYQHLSSRDYLQEMSQHFLKIFFLLRIIFETGQEQQRINRWSKVTALLSAGPNSIRPTSHGDIPDVRTGV